MKDKKRKVKIKKINYNPGRSGSRKNLILVSGAALLVIVLSAVIFMTLSSLFKTETYYVLNTNVKAKQRITPEMVVARETAAGTGPIHALSMEEIQRGEVYSKYPLFAGDVVASSNAGPLSGITLGIPDDWLVTSFTINSTDAVGGILGKGDYADLLGINEDGAQYIFNNILILEVKFLNDEYDGALEGQTVVGETMHYTIGLPAEAVAYFHDALNRYDIIKLVKSPTEINYKERDLDKLKGPFKYDSSIGNIDVFKGTDPTFTEVERDENGRPISQSVEGEVVDSTEDFEDNFDENEGLDEELSGEQPRN